MVVMKQLVFDSRLLTYGCVREKTDGKKYQKRDDHMSVYQDIAITLVYIF